MNTMNLKFTYITPDMTKKLGKEIITIYQNDKNELCLGNSLSSNITKDFIVIGGHEEFLESLDNGLNATVYQIASVEEKIIRSDCYISKTEKDGSLRELLNSTILEQKQLIR